MVLTVVLVVALLVVAGLSFATAMGAPLERVATVGAWATEALLGVAAVIDLGGIVAGRRPDELVTHLGYVLVSVALIPILVRPAGEDPTEDDVRGGKLVLSLACVAVIVVVLRQRATA